MDFEAACSVYIRFRGVNGYLKGEDLGAFAWIMGEACIRVPMREQRRIGGVYATLSPWEIG